jgi:hypothetical protein
VAGPRGALRQFLRGWGAILRRADQNAKARLLARIQELDMKADGPGLDDNGWALRYHLEEQFTELIGVEEEYWRQIGRQQWILQGDTNTKYFDAMANGRHQKCAILALNTGEGLTTDKLAIQGIVYAFYRELMDTKQPKRLALDPNIWPSHNRVTDQENNELLKSFSMEELEAILRETKMDTAPGPHGFPVLIYKKVLAHGQTHGAADTECPCTRES